MVCAAEILKVKKKKKRKEKKSNPLSALYGKGEVGGGGGRGGERDLTVTSNLMHQKLGNTRYGKGLLLPTGRFRQVDYSPILSKVWTLLTSSMEANVKGCPPCSAHWM